MHRRIPAWTLRSGDIIGGQRVRCPAYAIPGDRVAVLFYGGGFRAYNTIEAVEVTR
jgi:hypothetical protein